MRRSVPLLVPCGVTAIVMGLGLIHAHIAVPAYSFGGRRLAWALGYSALLAVAAYAVGLPDVPRRARQVATAAASAAIGGAIGISLLQLTAGDALLPRFVVFGALALTVPWFVLCAFLATWGRQRNLERDRILVVGGVEHVAQLMAELDMAPNQTVVIGATVSPEDARPRPGAPAPLCELAHECDASVIVLDRVAQLDQTIVDQAAILHEAGVRIRTLSLFYEQWLDRLPIAELERISLMFDIGEVHRERYARRKRIVDLAIALVALPVLVAAVPIVAVGNLVANRGPLMFRQARVGKGGRQFSILKFRTMKGTGSGPGRWTLDEDPRVTPWGGIMRRSHIDELPQLINVLKGELSIVGPRPEQPHYVSELTAKLPFYQLRHLVQPGLTGWAQVNQGYAATTGDALEKLQYEFWYLRHQRMAVDLRIMLRTVRTVTGGRGR